MYFSGYGRMDVRLICQRYANLPLRVVTFMYFSGHKRNRFPWDEWVCAFAAAGGHLMQWAWANGCRWDRWTCEYAAQRGRINVYVL